MSCSSGTDALIMALLALDVGPGDVVFTPAFTFVATAEVLPLIGATPAFVDVDPNTWNMDSGSLRDAIIRVRDERLGRARGVIAVDLFGLIADYSSIHEVAREHGLFVIQDAAQSIGSSASGRRAGSNAPIATTSFFPAKPLDRSGCTAPGVTNTTASASVSTAVAMPSKQQCFSRRSRYSKTK